MSAARDRVTIVVVGASGDLARRKVFPALFSLYSQGFLPADMNIVGFARSDLSDASFREHITEHLACRYLPGEKDCVDKMDAFLSRCCYVRGEYGSTDSYLNLYQRVQEIEAVPDTNRMFYLAIPPALFTDVGKAIGDAGFVQCGGGDPWSRVVVEKPFGKDRASSDQLVKALGQVFTEDQIYRIDHYLGKEVIQNLMVLRFANLVFEPLWNREYIKRIEISWKEEIGVEGRGGYFDEYGIIRDIMQNHLLQILALVCMERPKRLNAMEIMSEKVRVLKGIAPLTQEDLIVGQYDGYLDDPSVPDGSRTPTFGAVRLQVNNERWQGVPFVITAGKALDARMTEIKIIFKDATGSIFAGHGASPIANELVIRVQPDESITLRILNKVPGMGMNLAETELDLQYKSAFDEIIPDAYESLILDVLEGDKSLFIWNKELKAAWDIFTPVLHELDAKAVVPVPYELGSKGPEIW